MRCHKKLTKKLNNTHLCFYLKTLKVYWTPPQDIGDPSFCSIAYKTEDQPAPEIIIVRKEQHDHVISGLSLNTLYEIQIYCNYGIRQGPPTEWIGVSTRTGESLQKVHKCTYAATCYFQQCGILTSVDSDEPVQPPFKLRNSKWCSVSS